MIRIMCILLTVIHILIVIAFYFSSVFVCLSMVKIVSEEQLCARQKLAIPVRCLSLQTSHLLKTRLLIGNVLLSLREYIQVKVTVHS